MPRRLVFLFMAVILVSIAVVQTRHESRQRFAGARCQSDGDGAPDLILRHGEPLADGAEMVRHVGHGEPQ